MLERGKTPGPCKKGAAPRPSVSSVCSVGYIEENEERDEDGDAPFKDGAAAIMGGVAWRINGVVRYRNDVATKRNGAAAIVGGVDLGVRPVVPSVKSKLEFAGVAVTGCGLRVAGKNLKTCCGFLRGCRCENGFSRDSETVILIFLPRNPQLATRNESTIFLWWIQPHGLAFFLYL